MTPAQVETKPDEQETKDENMGGSEVEFDPLEGNPPFPRIRRRNRKREPNTSLEEYGEDQEGQEEEDAGPAGPERMGLDEFIETYKEAIARTVTESYSPLYQPTDPEQRQRLPRLLRRPIGAQEHALRGAALSLRTNPGTVVVGEMGTGKTYIGAAAAHMAGFSNILVLAPPHLVRKWKREIEMTVPGAQAAIVHTITGLRRLRAPTLMQGMRFTIMSRETAKLSFRWEPAYVVKQILKQDAGKALCCPGCFGQILDKDGIPVSVRQLGKKRMKCLRCEGALWQPRVEEHKSDCSCFRCTGQSTGRTPRWKHRRYALADYIKKYMRGFFDLLICDEVHEYKGRGTAQGIAGGNLAQACGNALTLTGGYSSTLFHLLYRFTPEIREDFKHNEQGRWIDRYGFRQKKYKHGSREDEPLEHGQSSGRRGYRTSEKETPGLAPAALFHIIGNTVFLRLNDVTQELPPYREQILMQAMSEDVAPGDGISQADAYDELYTELKQALQEALQEGSARLLAVYLQALLAFPDGCTRGEVVIDPETDREIVRIPPLSREAVYPKEEALTDLALAEKAEGRRLLVYTTHTDTRDITPRMEGFLSRSGLRVAVLKSDTVKSEKREDWVNEKVREGIDVLICNPRLVQTGLDLVDFPTLVWYAGQADRQRGKLPGRRLPREHLRPGSGGRAGGRAVPGGGRLGHTGTPGPRGRGTGENGDGNQYGAQHPAQPVLLGGIPGPATDRPGRTAPQEGTRNALTVPVGGGAGNEKAMRERKNHAHPRVDHDQRHRPDGPWSGIPGGREAGRALPGEEHQPPQGPVPRPRHHATHQLGRHEHRRQMGRADINDGADSQPHDRGGGCRRSPGADAHGGDRPNGYPIIRDQEDDPEELRRVLLHWPRNIVIAQDWHY